MGNGSRQSMPLKVPDELTTAIAEVREDNDTRWLVAGYEGSKALKLVGTGDGDFKDMLDTICADDQVHYGLINSPNGILIGYVEWTGENINGMKRSYIMRNLGQTNELFGYCHYTFKHSVRDELDAEMTENGEFAGERTLGEVKGWEPNLQDWQNMWYQTNPIDGWDPNSQWIYKWNPTGDLELANLPAEDMPRLKKIYSRCKVIPKSIVPKEFMDKLKQIQNAKKDEDLPPMSEEDMIIAARCEGTLDIYEGKNRDVGKLKKTDEPKKMKKIAPVPEPEPAPKPEPVAKKNEGPEEKKYFIYTTS